MKVKNQLTRKQIMILIAIHSVPPVVIKRMLAVLNMKKIKSNGAFIAKAKLVRQTMKGNVWFLLPPVLVDDGKQLDLDIQALDAAETLALTKVRGAAQARNVKKAIVLADLHLLLAYVQGIADLNPANSEAIIISSGFDLKHVGIATKQDLAVKAKKGESGTMIATARKIPGTLSNLWEYSLDGGLTWIEVEATGKGTTEITGLKPGSSIIVHHRPVLRKGKGQWLASAPTTVV